MRDQFETTLELSKALAPIDDVSVTPAGVPDGGTTVSLLGFGLLGLAGLRRKLSC
jgi:hypothetical protein